VILGNIGSLRVDGTHQTPTYTEKGMMLLSAQNIKPYRFMPENHKYVSYEDYLAYTARNKVQKGDILITRVGAGIGEVAMVDQDIDFAIYVSLGHIRAIQDFVYTPYLVHWLNSPAGVAQSREKILGKGHSQGNLNLNLIRQFLVPLPPLSATASHRRLPRQPPSQSRRTQAPASRNCRRTGCPATIHPRQSV
jgi:type I restriction enzyme S subunit